MMKLLRYALLTLLGVGSCLVLNTQIWQAPLLAADSVQLAQGGDRFATFIQADQLYRSGNASAAANLYRQVKPPFPDHADTLVVEPLYEPEELPSADLAFWNVAQRSIAENQVSGAIGALEELTQRAPGFILGHLQLAQILQQNDQSDKALAVLEQAATLHPTSSDVVMAHIKALQGDGQILEASIAARSFAIINPDHPQVGEFRAIADNELNSYLNDLRNRNIAQTVTGTFLNIFTGGGINQDTAIAAYNQISQLFKDESALGAELAAQYKQQLSLVDNPEVVDYVTQLGLSVAQLMGRDLDYEFYVVRDSSINAFALPGGKVFVNTGAILAANSEAELAGLMGHEVAHAVLSHGLLRVSAGNLLNELSDQLPYGQMVANIVNAQYSQQQERQSDILGARVLASSGYAADGLRNFMATLRDLTPGDAAGQPQYLASHPASSDRVSYLEDLIQTNGYNRYALEGVDRHQVIKALL